MTLARRLAHKRCRGQNGQAGLVRGWMWRSDRGPASGRLGPRGPAGAARGRTGPRRRGNQAPAEELRAAANAGLGNWRLATRTTGAAVGHPGMGSPWTGPPCFGLRLLRLNLATKRRRRIAEVSTRRQKMLAHKLTVALGKSDCSPDRQVEQLERLVCELLNVVDTFLGGLPHVNSRSVEWPVLFHTIHNATGGGSGGSWPFSAGRPPERKSPCQHPRIPNGPVLALLHDRVALSSGSACTLCAEVPSHVLLAIGLDEELVEGCGHVFGVPREPHPFCSSSPRPEGGRTLSPGGDRDCRR